MNQSTIARRLGTTSVLLTLLISTFSGTAFSQVAGLAGLTGVVRDATGAVVADATVNVINEGKGVRRAFMTNGAGVFNSPALVPADGYQVTVEKSGFRKYESTPITLEVGQNLNLNISIDVASAATQVEVSAVAPVVEDTKTDVSQVVAQRQIQDLPVNGRRVDQFVLLAPAVAPDGAFGLLSFRGVAGHNAFLTDGNDTTNQYYNENAGRTRISSQISQDAIQEFQVVSNNFAAEYGNAMGGVVNTITKSGQNGVHGSAYTFFRNRSLNARDRYATFNPQDIRAQFGASVGGKIIKDKLFYFFNYEGTRRDFPAIASLSTGIFNSSGQLVSSPATANGACNTGPIPTQLVMPGGGPFPTTAQCTAAANMILQRNFGTVSRTVRQDLGFGRLDYHLNDRNTLSASLSMLRWVSPHGIQATGLVFNTGSAIGNNADSSVRNAYGKVSLTSVIGSSMVNEARFGWFKDKLYDPASPDFLFPGLGLAQLSVGGTGNLGVADTYPRLNPSEQRFSFSDSLSWTKGAHTMKFGVDIAHTEDYQDQLITRFGSYVYTNLTNFAADFNSTSSLKNWTSYSQRFGNSVVDMNMKTLGFYAQDQWRVNSRLLVNYGVRYDYSWLPQPTISNPDYPATAKIPSAKDNIAPRVGISYSLGKDRKTLLRAGYGIFFARYQTGLINTFLINNNLYQKSVTYLASNAAQLAAGPTYPNFLPSTTLSVPAASSDVVLADQNLKNPYTHQANVGIDRQISSTMSFSASYVWSRGVRLYGVRDLNIGALGPNVTYDIQVPVAGTTPVAYTTVGTYTTPTYTSTKVDNRYRRVSLVDNPGLSYYNALALQVNKRFSKGFQGGFAYTWGHAIDFNQSNANNNIFFSATPTSYANGNFVAEKGSAANDVRHRAVINFVWSPTFTKSTSKLARYAINDWQLSQVTTLQSSQPLNSTTNIPGAAYAGAPFTGSLNGLQGGFSRVPFEPLSNLDLDRIYKVDARLAKKFPINERWTAYLQFEAFNVFNTPYDTSRRQQEYDFVAAVAATPTSPASNAALRKRADYGTGSSTASSPDGTNARRAQVSVRVTF